jgi:hypothetical protein
LEVCYDFLKEKLLQICVFTELFGHFSFLSGLHLERLGGTYTDSSCVLSEV